MPMVLLKLKQYVHTGATTGLHKGAFEDESHITVQQNDLLGGLREKRNKGKQFTSVADGTLFSLKEPEVDPGDIRPIKCLQQIQPISKKNCLQKHKADRHHRQMLPITQ